MQFDMAAKRAQRLLGKNWAKVQAEAHRVGSLGLPSLTVLVNEDSIFLEAVGLQGSLGRATLGAGGWVKAEWPYTLPDGISRRMREEQVMAQEAVARILASALAEAKRRAIDVARTTEELAKVRQFLKPNGFPEFVKPGCCGIRVRSAVKNSTQ